MNFKGHDWFLVQFKSNSHQLAKRNLCNQGFQTFLPLHKVTSRKKSRFSNDIKPLFPGYMFVCAKCCSPPLHKINSTLGVSRLVSSGGKPKPVPEELVRGLMARCNPSDELLPPKYFAKGDTVEFLRGALASFVATVEMISSDQRVWVMMELMGRSTKVQASVEQLKENF